MSTQLDIDDVTAGHAAARAELDALRARVAELESENAALRARVAELEAALSAAEKDARRYRLIRDPVRNYSGIYPCSEDEAVWNERLDASIDAALAEQERP